MAEKVKPFEKIFPYISYRYKYDDGEFSPYAPFTEAQFLSEKPSETALNDRYEKGFNVNMVNAIENLSINNIPKGTEDVVSIDILYTESISSTVYILKTIEISPEERGDGYLNNIIISKRAFGAALPDSELTRQFDSVPRSAKAQEFTANRLIYGNYLSKYDQSLAELGDEGFKLSLGLGVISLPKSGLSVKTNRTYDVGVSYLDKYGRQGGLLTQATGANNEDTSLIKTDFCYNGRIKLIGTINSSAPSWATDYKYYIKDVSNDFFNLTAFNTYLDGEPGDTEATNVYLQFDSKDRNKLTEDSFLMPRRDGMSGADSRGTVIEELSRLPVLAIENEAPDIVKAQVIERTSIKAFTIHDESIVGVVGFNSGNQSGQPNNGEIKIPINPNAANNQDIFVSQEDYTLTHSGKITPINKYVQGQDSSKTKLDQYEPPLNQQQIIDLTDVGERLALQIVEVGGSNIATKKMLVDTIVLGQDQSTGDNERKVLKFTLSNRLSDNNEILSNKGIDVAPTEGGTTGWNVNSELEFKFFKLGLSEAGQKKLKGSFFVKVPRKTESASFPKIPINQTELDEEGKVEKINFLDFETEPGDDSNLNLYWESSKIFSVSDDHGQPNTIPWSNCIATIGGTNNKTYLESVKIQDKFNSTSMVKGIRVNTPEPNYGEERRKNGLIFSGLYNSRTGINELNKFNLTDGITKNLEPNYGGIQKLFALDTNLLAFCEDKVFKILADKDALFNADDGVNVTATNLVLGQAMSFQGEYGISTHPESFANFGNNIYFTDAKRGVVMH